MPDYTAGLTGSVAGLTIGVPIPYFFDQPALNSETKAAVLAAVSPALWLNDAGLLSESAAAVAGFVAAGEIDGLFAEARVELVERGVQRLRPVLGGEERAGMAS